MSSLPRPTVSIVTYHSAEYIAPCIRSLLGQTLPPEEILVTDNASPDGSAEIVEREFAAQARLIRNRQNLGFSIPHNRAIRSIRSKYVLVLNPDTQLNPDYLERLTLLLESHPGLGSATGKLLRMDPAFRPIFVQGLPLIDSTGICFLPNQRHADRGNGQLDRGQFAIRQLVFGTTGAAGFYRRAMLEDIAIDGEYFDEGFFVYREDVDLAWRSILYGWACAYDPEAVGYHVRYGIPERRHLLSSEINYHSVKNRYLLRWKNMPWSVYGRHLGAISFRDLLVVGYALYKEHASLRAFSFLWRHRRRYGHLRKIVAGRSRILPRDIEKWIDRRPKALPFDPPPSPLAPKGDCLGDR